MMLSKQGTKIPCLGTAGYRPTDETSQLKERGHKPALYFVNLKV